MKYKINRDQPPLTEGELASARNFNNIIKGYRNMKVPFYRSGKFLTRGSAIIVAAAVALMVLFDDKTDTPQPGFISPPLAQAVIPIDSFAIDADSATDIEYKSGSKLHIPADAFRDANGHPVKGKVVLKYREFHDQKDIFLSGVPMTYDSAGRTYVFESAGMMEIGAAQNGRPLSTNPDKSIVVDMVSNTQEDRYNTYYLDTASKRWINLNQANLKPAQYANNNSGISDSIEQHDALLTRCDRDLKKTIVAVKTIEKEKPQPIAKADKGKTKFHIDIDPAEFPEIAMYKGVRFQVKDEKNFDKASARMQWEDVKLKKLTGMDYEITFAKGNKTFKVVATPVIDDKDLAAAQKVYDQKFAEYQVKLSEKKTAEEKAKKELADYQAGLAGGEKARREQLIASRKNAGFQEIELRELEQQEMINRTGKAVISAETKAGIKQTDLIFRTFVVSNFGVYNADCPNCWPTGSSVIANLISDKGDKLDLTTVYLVSKGLNIVYPYPVSDGECTDLRFDSTSDNMLWAMTRDNKLVVADAGSFKARRKNANKVEFRFKLTDKKFNSYDEVKKYLEI